MNDQPDTPLSVRDRARRSRRARRTCLALVVGALLASLLPAGLSPAAAQQTSPGRVVLVAGSAPLPPPADREVVSLLEDLGFEVTVIDDDTPNLFSTVRDADADVIGVSSSVVFSKVGSRLAPLPVPIVTWEAYLHKDFGLAKRGEGESAPGTRLQMSPIVSSLVDNLSGELVDVTATPQPIAFGVAADGVETLASLPGAPHRAAILHMRAGTETPHGPAPADRIGLFASYLSPVHFTDVGAAIFGRAFTLLAGVLPPEPNLPPVVNAGDDITLALPAGSLTVTAEVLDDGGPLDATWSGPDSVTVTNITGTSSATITFPGAGTFELTATADDGEFVSSDTLTITVLNQRPTGRTLLYVNGNGSAPWAPDAAMIARIEGLGATVVTADDDALPADLDDIDGIVISSTVIPSKVGDTYRDADVPILTWEPFLFDDLGLSNGAPGETADRLRHIDIIDPSGPLAAGFGPGLVNVTTVDRKLSFARDLGPDADIVATVPGRPDRAVLFGVDQGDQLGDGSTAAARRVGFFANFDAPRRLSTTGGLLADAALSWFLAGTEHDVPVALGPDRSFADADEVLTVGPELTLVDRDRAMSIFDGEFDVDPLTGHLVIIDLDGNIRRMAPTGEATAVVTAPPRTSFDPLELAVDPANGDIYLGQDDTVFTFDRDGNPKDVFDIGFSIEDLDVMGRGAGFVVAQRFSTRVAVFDAEGRPTAEITGLPEVGSLAVDRRNNRIVIMPSAFAPFPSPVSVFESNGTPVSLNLASGLASDHIEVDPFTGNIHGAAELLGPTGGPPIGDPPPFCGRCSFDPRTGNLIDRTVEYARGVLANDVGEGLVIVDADTMSANGATVMVNADGSYTFDPSTSAAAQALAAGEFLTDTFTYTVQGTNGEMATGTVEVVVTGVS